MGNKGSAPQPQTQQKNNQAMQQTIDIIIYYGSIYEGPIYTFIKQLIIIYEYL